MNEVTNRQMAFILIITVCTMSITPVAKAMAASAGHGAWVTLLLTGVVFAAMTVIIIKLNRMFEGKVLFDYSREILGRAAPYFLGFIYILYFLIFSTYYCTGFTTVLHSSILMKTPEWAILLAGMPVYGLVAYRGITNIGRLVEIVGIIFLIVSIILLVTMLFQGKLNNILPLFTASKAGQYIFSVKDAFVYFLGIEALTVIPLTAKNKKAAKTAFFAVMGIALYFILDVYGAYAILGMDETKYHNYPLLDAIRLVEYPNIEFLQRVDIVYDTSGFLQVVAGKSIIYLVVVEYICKFIPKVKRIFVVLFTGIVLFILSTAATEMQDRNQVLTAILSWGGIFCAFIIPLFLFVAAKVKKNAQKNS